MRNDPPTIIITGASGFIGRYFMDMVKEQSLTYPIIFGNEDTAGDFGGMNGMPTSFLYSPDGKLIGHHDGPLTLSELEQAIQQKPEAAALFVRK